MAHQETVTQQIARRLRVSERVLEQYLQLKRAEVESDPATDDDVHANVQAPLDRAELVKRQRASREKRA